MAYNAKGLQVLSGFGASTTGSAEILRAAHYVTADAAATVEAANYFNSAAARLPKGTIIHAVMAFGGTPILKTYVVTSNNGTTVVIALQTATAG